MMKDGLYLSIYTHVNPLAYLYKISLRHDHGMALWKKKNSKIELVKYWEFERKSGLKKHDLSFYSVDNAKNAVNKLLADVGVSIDDIEMIWGTPGLEKINDDERYPQEFQCPLHSLCHLFSGMMSDSNDFYNGKILALALDGGPDNVIDENAREKKFYWGAMVKHGEIEYFPVPSPGAFWSFLKIEYSLEEGSLMAIGSAANAKFANEDEFLSDIPNVYEGKDFDNAFKWISNIVNKSKQLTKENILQYDDRFNLEENRVSMVVKVVQRASYLILDQIMKKAIYDFNIEPTDTVLSMTGGFALNCPTNSYVMEKYKFKKFATCPSVSDSGIALGLGLYEFYKRCDSFEYKLGNAYHGYIEKRKVEEISEDWSPYVKSISDFTEEEFCRDLMKYPLIWFQGQAEIGPRALGARSLLGDPRKEETKAALNRIKKRQWWRPVAPIVLEEEQSKWFEDTFKSPYMLCTSKVKEDKKNYITAALHLDSSARIQSISEKDNEVLYSAIKSFFKTTNVPIICNTSLNDKGEPIIDTFDQCLNFAIRKKVNIVYMNERRIELENFDEYTEKKPYVREIAYFDTLSDEEKKEAEEKYNPFGFDKKDLDLYLNLPELRKYDACDEKDAKKLKRILSKWKKLNQTVWKALLT
ncbi:MAG: carbamoyltransferase [Clostridium sp.]|nr:carbamoyltransferase [Clostridium sp.]